MRSSGKKKRTEVTSASRQQREHARFSHKMLIREAPLNSTDLVALEAKVTEGIQTFAADRLPMLGAIAASEAVLYELHQNRINLTYYKNQRREMYRDESSLLLFAKRHIRAVYDTPRSRQFSKQAFAAVTQRARTFFDTGLAEFGTPFIVKVWLHLRAEDVKEARRKITPSLVEIRNARDTQNWSEEEYKSDIAQHNVRAAKLRKTSSVAAGGLLPKDEATPPMEGPLPDRKNTPDTRRAKGETTRRMGVRETTSSSDRHKTRKEEGHRLFGAYVEEELIEAVEEIRRTRKIPKQQLVREMMLKTVAEYGSPAVKRKLEELIEADIKDYAESRRRLLTPKLK